MDQNHKEGLINQRLLGSTPTYPIVSNLGCVEGVGLRICFCNKFPGGGVAGPGYTLRALALAYIWDNGSYIPLTLCPASSYVEKHQSIQLISMCYPLRVKYRAKLQGYKN